MLRAYQHSDLPAAQTVRKDSGIVVLSMTRRILHANQSAFDLVRHLSMGSSSMFNGMAPLQLPPSLLEFVERVVIHLEKRIAAEEWAQFEIKHTLRIAGQNLFLRGFGLPDKTRRQQSRVLITMHPIACAFAA